jgi:hypothetical protein
MQSDAITAQLSDFRSMEANDQQRILQGMMATSDPGALQRATAAASAASADTQRALLAAFPGVGAKERGRLYRTMLWMLGILAFSGLVGGAIALVTNKESAAFFTFAGLALGGITGILVPAPSGVGTG